MLLTLSGYAVALVAMVLAWALYKDMRVKAQYSHIPSPPGLPLFGHSTMINKKQSYKTFLAWKEKYGEVFCIFLFGTPCIIVNGHEAVYELLVGKGKEFAGRSTGFHAHIIARNTGFVWMDINKQYHDLRKVCVRSIKAFGPGLKRIHTYSMQLMDEFVEDIESSNGKPFDPYNTFYAAILRKLP